jgi:hypothetical protein
MQGIWSQDLFYVSDRVESAITKHLVFLCDFHCVGYDNKSMALDTPLRDHLCSRHGGLPEQRCLKKANRFSYYFPTLPLDLGSYR